MMMMMMIRTHLKGKSWHKQWLGAYSSCSSKVHFSIQRIEGRCNGKEGYKYNQQIKVYKEMQNP